MTDLYRLMHYKVGPGDNITDTDPEDEKSIGLYSTRSEAETVAERMRRLEGFREWPGGFRVLEVTLDVEEDWAEGFEEGPEGDVRVSAVEAS